MIPIEGLKLQSCSKNKRKCKEDAMNCCNTIASNNLAHDCRLTKQWIRF